MAKEKRWKQYHLGNNFPYRREHYNQEYDSTMQQVTKGYKIVTEN